MECYAAPDKLFVYIWRIPGAVKMAGVWLIPKEAEKPKDRRYNESR